MTGDISLVPKSDRRKWRRLATQMVATVNYGRTLLPCFVADLSLGGAKIKLMEQTKLPPGPTILECGRFGTVAAELVWQKGQFAGLRFFDPAGFAERLKGTQAGAVAGAGFAAPPPAAPVAAAAPAASEGSEPYPSIRREPSDRRLEPVS